MDKGIRGSLRANTRSAKKLPKLYYLIDGAPIYLYTDASQVGLGGYLYQMVATEESLSSLPLRTAKPLITAMQLIIALPLRIARNDRSRLYRQPSKVRRSDGTP